MTFLDTFNRIKEASFPIYGEREASSISNMVLEKLTGLGKAERWMVKSNDFPTALESRIKEIVVEIKKHKPIQYILQEAWFCGLPFYVDENVLIPRPETEELIDCVHSDLASKPQETSILDIGTGSGCLAITLKKKHPLWKVSALDISISALEIAKRNAKQHETAINWHELDFLNENKWNHLGTFNTFVSNPPYIPYYQSTDMAKNVLDYEPATALFVENKNPLIFYEKIASFGLTHLKFGGKIWVEINEYLGNETLSVFKDMGYQSELKKDMMGKDRMVAASL